MPKSKRSAALYLGLVFVSGVLVGAFSHRLFLTRSVAAAPRSPEEWRKRYVSDMRERMRLDDQQVQQLQIILDETRHRYHELREREKPLAQAIQADQIEKVRSMLREDQRAAYEQFRGEREKRRQELDRKQKGSPRYP